ncbi:unnamed protein product [Cladocopium goreaui]|uniref:Uncharacterized protein n=1 Tax=Cladocopium goreaui TaxID=2562237 RepID=A0A9P1FEY8_9DINO|nr:unnamed protein product [Cladocopium goreaui]
MDTVEASKVDRLPVRGSASKVLEDVAVPEGYVPGSFLQKFMEGNLAEAVAMDAAPRCSADAWTADDGASADAPKAATDVGASADAPKAADDAAHEGGGGGGGGSVLPAPPPPPPPPAPTAVKTIKVKAMPRPRPAHPKGQPPPKHVAVVNVDDESCSSPSSSWKTPAAMVQHDADGSWQTWQHGDASNSWKTPAAMLQHDADGSWQTWQHGDASNSWKTPAAMLQHDADGSWQTWQHGDASQSQTAWHADGANWHHATACMSQTVQSDGWSANREVSWSMEWHKDGENQPQKRIRDASNRRRGGWKYQKAQANRQMAMERQEQGERIDHALEIMGSLARSTMCFTIFNCRSPERKSIHANGKQAEWKFACRSCHQQQKVLADRALYHWRRADWCFHTLSRNGMALDLLQHVKDGHFTVGEDIYHQRREDLQDMSLGHRPVAIAATVMLLQIPGTANYIHDVGYLARGRWYESYAGMLQLRDDHWSVHVVELFAWHLFHCLMYCCVDRDGLEAMVRDEHDWDQVSSWVWTRLDINYIYFEDCNDQVKGLCASPPSTAGGQYARHGKTGAKGLTWIFWHGRLIQPMDMEKK